jgi:hypothetical protein
MSMKCLIVSSLILFGACAPNIAHADRVEIMTAETSYVPDAYSYFVRHPTVTVVTRYELDGSSYPYSVYMQGEFTRKPFKIQWSDTIPANSKLRFQYITAGGATRYAVIQLSSPTVVGLREDGVTLWKSTK